MNSSNGVVAGSCVPARNPKLAFHLRIRWFFPGNAGTVQRSRKLAELSASGRRAWAERFTWQTIANQIEQLATNARG